MAKENKKVVDENAYNFDDHEKDTLTKPRDTAWGNFAKFEKVGDMYQGYIVDVFFKKAENQFKEARCFTLKQLNGELVNVPVKRLPFMNRATDGLRLGDPLTVKFTSEIPNKQKGYNPTKVITCTGKNLPKNAGNKTVRELEAEDYKIQMNKDIQVDVPEANEDVTVESTEKSPF